MHLARAIFVSLILHVLLFAIAWKPYSLNIQPRSISAKIASGHSLSISLSNHRNTDESSKPINENPPTSATVVFEPTATDEHSWKDQSQPREKTSAAPASATPKNYFSRHDLDRPARIIENLDIKDGSLDIALRKRPEHGRVQLECLIDERGNVDEVIILTSTLPDDITLIVKDHASRAKFIPGRINRQAVPSKLSFELTIQGSDSE